MAETRVAKRASARRKTRSRASSARANIFSGPVRGFEPYRPKRGEPYMSEGQIEHFRQLLNAWKLELMEEVDRTMLHMKDDAANFPDPSDRATQESDFGLELRTRDRERKLLRKIDSALLRIDEGSYGYCEETGDEIGLRRLEARTVATLCLEAQETAGIGGTAVPGPRGSLPLVDSYRHKIPDHTDKRAPDGFGSPLIGSFRPD